MLEFRITEQNTIRIDHSKVVADFTKFIEFKLELPENWEGLNVNGLFYREEDETLGMVENIVSGEVRNLPSAPFKGEEFGQDFKVFISFVGTGADGRTATSSVYELTVQPSGLSGMNVTPEGDEENPFARFLRLVEEERKKAEAAAKTAAEDAIEQLQPSIDEIISAAGSASESAKNAAGSEKAAAGSAQSAASDAAKAAQDRADADQAVTDAEAAKQAANKSALAAAASQAAAAESEKKTDADATKTGQDRTAAEQAASDAAAAKETAIQKAAAAEQSGLQAAESEQAATDAAEQSNVRAAAAERAAEAAQAAKKTAEEKASAATQSEQAAADSEAKCVEASDKVSRAEAAAVRAEQAANSIQEAVDANNAAQAAKTETISAKNATIAAAQTAQLEAEKVQKIVAGNEAYTKTESDLKYTVAPRKEASSANGELKLTDADDGLSYLELQGNSEQYTATGTNLFDVKQLVKTMQGLQPERITLMQDGDGKFMRITNNYWHNGRLYTFVNDITKSYEIGFKGRFVSGSPGHLIFAVKFKDGTIINTGRIAGEKEYKTVNTTIPIGKEVDYMYFTYGNSAGIYDVLLNGFYLYPTDAPSSEKPTGGYGTPTPDYPSEVKSVGDIPKDVNGVEIKNILDIDGILARPDSDWTVSVSGRTFSISLDVSKQKIGGRLFEAFNHPNINVGLSSSSTALGETSGFYLSAPSIQYKSFDFSSKEAVYLFIYFTGSAEVSIALVKEILDKERNKFVFTYASEVDEYRPYIGENNGLAKIESIGLNHADPKQVLMTRYSEVKVNEDNSVIKATQTIIDGGASSYIYFNYEKSRQYTLYCKAKFIELSGTGGRSFVGIRDKTGIKSAIIQQGINTNNVINEVLLNFTATEDGLGVMLYIQPDVNTSRRELYVYDLMIVEGEKTLQEMKALKFQPYYNQITWIPLREPLRGLPDGTTDIIDKGGNVVQSIGSSGIMQYGITQESAQIYNGNLFHTALGNIVGIAKKDNGVYCNIMGYNPTVSSEYGIAASTSYNVIYFNLKGKLLENTTELAKQFLTDNDAIFYFVLKTPIMYQIPAVYIETYDQETNVMCMNKVKPSDMTLDYKIAMSSLIKRLEALETKTVQEV